MVSLLARVDLVALQRGQDAGANCVNGAHHLNDIGKETVMADITAWIGARLPTP